MTLIQLVAFSLIIGLGLNGFFIVISAISKPEIFVRYFDMGFKEGPLGNARWWYWPFGLFTLLSLGRIIYCAAYSITFALPASWGSVNEDGDWQSARFQVAFWIAFIGAPLLMNGLDKAAKALLQASSQATPAKP